MEAYVFHNGVWVMPGEDRLWPRVLEECSVECGELAEKFMEESCKEELCWQPRSTNSRKRYEWVKKIIDSGVPDGRSRLILYVISRYLLNVLGLSEEEALREIEVFLENSCQKHGRCGGIYKSWIRSVVKHVAKGGWKPWTLERMSRDDPQLYDIVKGILENEG